jgi:hypothetical protein
MADRLRGAGRFAPLGRAYLWSRSALSAGWLRIRRLGVRLPPGALIRQTRGSHRETSSRAAPLRGSLPGGRGSLVYCLPDRGQLPHPQAFRGGRMARGPPQVPPALHADELLVAQPRRALLRRDHPQTHPTRQLSQRQRAHRCHQTTTCARPTPIPSRSYGRPKRTTSSRRSRSVERL